MDNLKNLNSDFRISEASLRYFVRHDSHKTPFKEANMGIIKSTSAYKMSQKSAQPIRRDDELEDLPTLSDEDLLDNFILDENLPADFPDTLGLDDDLVNQLQFSPPIELNHSVDTFNYVDQIITDEALVNGMSYDLPNLNSVMTSAVVPPRTSHANIKILEQTVIKPADTSLGNYEVKEPRAFKLLTDSNKTLTNAPIKIVQQINNSPIKMMQPVKKLISFIPLTSPTFLTNTNNLIVGSRLTNEWLEPVKILKTTTTNNNMAQQNVSAISATTNSVILKLDNDNSKIIQQNAFVNNKTNGFKYNKARSKPKPVAHAKVNTNLAKPTEDEKTILNVQKILDRYTEQVTNDPDLKTKAAPRRRSNPMANDAKRKKIWGKKGDVTPIKATLVPNQASSSSSACGTDRNVSVCNNDVMSSDVISYNNKTGAITSSIQSQPKIVIINSMNKPSQTSAANFVVNSNSTNNNTINAPNLNTNTWQWSRNNNSATNSATNVIYVTKLNTEPNVFLQNHNTNVTVKANLPSTSAFNPFNSKELQDFIYFLESSLSPDKLPIKQVLIQQAPPCAQVTAKSSAIATATTPTKTTTVLDDQSVCSIYFDENFAKSSSTSCLPVNLRQEESNASKDLSSPPLACDQSNHDIVDTPTEQIISLPNCPVNLKDIQTDHCYTIPSELEKRIPTNCSAQTIQSIVRKFHRKQNSIVRRRKLKRKRRLQLGAKLGNIHGSVERLPQFNYIQSRMELLKNREQLRMTTRKKVNRYISFQNSTVTKSPLKLKRKKLSSAQSCNRNVLIKRSNIPKVPMVHEVPIAPQDSDSVTNLTVTFENCNYINGVSTKTLIDMAPRRSVRLHEKKSK